MSCFSCFSSVEKRASKKFDARKAPSPAQVSKRTTALAKEPEKTREKKNNAETITQREAGNGNGNGSGNIAAQTFTFRELASATKNFRPDCLLGEGGFGRLDRNGLQGNREFLVEVLMLSLLHHPNLVNLIGYCADGDQRLLVYEFMAMGSLEDHLLDIPPNRRPLSWHTRMRIAHGAAKGLEYLHDKANPPVIYRDLKSPNILLDREFNPKLSDFGLAKLSPVGDNVHVSSRVMGTYGYCAPEYARTGQLTVKSDVYSFGVVMLELITGRRAIDTRRPTLEQNLTTWAQPMFKDQKRFPELVDPLLQGEYPPRALNQAVAVAAMCLQEDALVRPMMADVVLALNVLAVASEDDEGRSSPSFRLSLQNEEQIREHQRKLDEYSDAERQRAVAQAIQWGSSNSRNSKNLQT
ncbi:hypothetical protein J5N97_014812 [Dioscorea zingiberensis]|uniref:Protein kinase domain-containing protein n=1 Tax=Dioscorea zingiberensis TaxID=325984 RepID=A0A9D5HK45_9LILI|nr:hypothetical protein J5N97_014812 [Dioscorea zingiberensis]